MIGHLLGAAGAAEAIVTIGALTEQVAPPTAGLDQPDPECTLDYVPHRARPLRTDVALSNNFAFGGANACLVITRPRTRPAPPIEDSDPAVVTGIAVLSPAGGGIDGAWQAYRDRRHVHSLRDGLRQGTVEVDPEPYLTRRERRRMDRLTVLSIVSATRALSAAGLTPRTDDIARGGVIFGTGVGPMETMEGFVQPLLTDVRGVGDPGVFPNTVYNQAAGQVAQHLGLYGPTSTLSVGHSTGVATLGYAADLIRAGHAELLIATVTDTLTAQVARAYAANRLVSSRADSAPPDGRFALSEGSVSFVLQSRSAAQAHGAVVLAEIGSAGMSSDGGAADRWNGHGIERAIHAALLAGSASPKDVGDVWLAAAGHAPTDRIENAAVSRVFDPEPSGPRRHTPKVFLGEPLGVGGALSTALAIRKWSDGPVAPAMITTSSLTGSHAGLLVKPPRREK